MKGSNLPRLDDNPVWVVLVPDLDHGVFDESDHRTASTVSESSCVALSDLPLNSLGPLALTADSQTAIENFRDASDVPLLRQQRVDCNQ